MLNVKSSMETQNHIEIARNQAKEWGRMGGLMRKKAIGKKGFSSLGKKGAEKRWRKTEKPVDNSSLTA